MGLAHLSHLFGGGYALIVDAKDATAKAFYERHGFRSFQDTPQSLYLPLGC